MFRIKFCIGIFEDYIYRLLLLFQNLTTTWFLFLLTLLASGLNSPSWEDSTTLFPSVGYLSSASPTEGEEATNQLTRSSPHSALEKALPAGPTRQIIIVPLREEETVTERSSNFSRSQLLVPDTARTQTHTI